MARKNTGLMFSDKSFLDLSHFSVIFGTLRKEPPSLQQIRKSRPDGYQSDLNSVLLVCRNRSFPTDKLQHISKSNALPLAARIIVTKKQGNAILRSKIKRKIKEAIRTALLDPDLALTQPIQIDAVNHFLQIGLVILTKNTILEEKFSKLRFLARKMLKIIAKKHLYQ